MSDIQDRTIQATAVEATLVAGAVGLPGGGATQMGGSVACPVCRTMNSQLETYCAECGFLLGSTPGADAEPRAEETGCSLTDDRTGRAFPLHAGDNTVGREACDVLLLDATVSRRHAAVTLTDGGLTVTDFGSTNGTQVDGAPVPANQPTPAGHGSVIRFGSSSLTVSAPGRAADEAPAPPAAVPDEPAAAEAQGDAVATLTDTTDASFVIALTRGDTTLGRRQTCTVPLANDPYVSGLHALVTCDELGCTLADSGSTNGTLMNGKRLAPLQPESLLDGDEVQIGRRSFAFRWIGPAAPEADEPAEAPLPSPAAGDQEP
jgi:pSer/pThr/pTyr-binding forkhead associated (FHA) protein